MNTRSTLGVRLGFTLVEVLVVIAIIGVIIGLMLPATQGLREMARRSSCQQNLIELSLALSAYHETQGHYPTGTLNPSGPILNVQSGYHHNWIAALLPHLDAQVVYDRIDSQVSVYAPENSVVRQASFPFLLCPSASNVSLNTTCYAGIHHSTEAPIDEDNDGVFVLNRATSNRDITDGLSYTMFLGEKLSVPDFDFGWISGTRSTLRNAGHAIGARDGAWPPLFPATSVQSDDYSEMTVWDEYEPIDGQDAANEPLEAEPPAAIDPINPLFVGGLQSNHPGGAHILTGAGEVSFRSSSMDQRLMRQMANKADGTIPVDVLDESAAEANAKAEAGAATATTPAP